MVETQELELPETHVESPFTDRRFDGVVSRIFSFGYLGPYKTHIIMKNIRYMRDRAKSSGLMRKAIEKHSPFFEKFNFLFPILNEYDNVNTPVVVPDSYLAECSVLLEDTQGFELVDGRGRDLGVLSSQEYPLLLEARVVQREFSRGTVSLFRSRSFIQACRKLRTRAYTADSFVRDAVNLYRTLYRDFNALKTAE